MKTLSIRHPWAELIISGKKTIEIRTWNTNYRGEFYVHASKAIKNELLERFSFNKDQLAFGGIIGIVELIDVIHYVDEKKFNNDYIKHFGTWDGPCYGFVLRNPIRTSFKLMKGRLGFFNVSAF